MCFMAACLCGSICAFAVTGGAPSAVRSLETGGSYDDTTGLTDNDVGSAEVKDVIPHPADGNTDWRLVLSEAIAYLSGWQQGSNPMAYAIRAAYLWQNGEWYHYDAEMIAPLCWVLGAVEPEGEGEGECQDDEDCDDSDLCTDDSCDPATGCVHTPINCDDGNACTTDVCDPLEGCVHTPVYCDDGVACTVDSCDPATGCVNTPDDTLCDDGNACSDGSCDPATGCVFAPITCDDGNACTEDSCDPATGCVFAPITCDDGNSCTDDGCDPATGCVFAPITCDDGNACTNDSCDPATGCVSVPITCDDGNACTNDSCDPATGCVSVPITCDDSDLCTDDGCDPASGCVQTPIDVDDGIECTVDTCDAATGHVNAPNDALCDDLIACTVDTCDAATGCVNTPNDAACDDLIDCTVDTCDAATGCVNTPNDTACDDGNPNTVDTCDPVRGCVYTLNVMLPGDVPLELVWIPSGSFQMGRYPGEADSYMSEDPQHPVTLAYGFWMGKYEITQQQWLAVRGSWPGTAPSATYGLGNTYPAYYISWDDTKNFITSLNAHIVSSGQGPLTVRLPSEAEWEYACRAGTTTRFYFGDSLGCAVDCSDCAAGTLPGNRTAYMWYCGNNSPSGSKAVGGKTANAFGLYDMSGNVYEWCEDDYHSSYTGAPTNGSAWVDSPRASIRLLRGGRRGSHGAGNCRSAFRYSAAPGYRYYAIGFRLAAVR